MRRGRMLSVGGRGAWQLQEATPILFLLQLCAALWSLILWLAWSVEWKQSFVFNVFQTRSLCPHCLQFSHEHTSFSDVPFFAAAFHLVLFSFSLSVLLLISPTFCFVCLLIPLFCNVVFLSPFLSSPIRCSPLLSLINTNSLWFSLSLHFYLSSASTVSLADSYSVAPMRRPDEIHRELWPSFHGGDTISDKPSAAMSSKVHTHIHTHIQYVLIGHTKPSHAATWTKTRSECMSASFNLQQSIHQG